MRLAIVGSTRAPKQAQVIIEDVLDEFNPDVVVSGGAVGVDTMAIKAAKRRGIRPVVHEPEINQWEDGLASERGFKRRNMLIAIDCDFLVRIAIKNATTYGSGWTRDYAKKLGKPTREYVL